MTATKLTKTEIEVLNDAAKHPKGRVYVQDWSRGSFKMSGKGSGGGRRYHAAMCKLRDKGLLNGYDASHSHGRSPHGELTIYSTEAIAFITEAGKGGDPMMATPLKLKGKVLYRDGEAVAEVKGYREWFKGEPSGEFTVWHRGEKVAGGFCYFRDAVKWAKSVIGEGRV